jgi:hypothetical protein
MANLIARMAECINGPPAPLALTDEAAIVMRLAWCGFRVKEIGDNLDAVLAAAQRERANAVAERETAITGGAT